MGIRKALASTLGQKYLMALTGWVLVLFTVFHLAGNLLLLKRDGRAFNLYSQTLVDTGWILYLAEAALLLVALVHIGVAVRLRMLAKRARPVLYAAVESKGGPSKEGISTRTLFLSGVVVLVFLIIHIWHFKYGPDVEEGYVGEVAGKTVRDMHRVVVEGFKNPFYVLFYVFGVSFLGLHLKHGVWSSFQSFGSTRPWTSSRIYAAGVILAALITIGYVFLPLWIYFGPPAPGGST